MSNNPYNDAMLQEALEEREQMNSRKKKTMRLVMVACFLGFTGSSYAWYASSPENQEKVHGMWNETVAVRQDQVLDAADSIGADMSNDAESQARLDRDMKKITGDEKTVGQRDAALRENFGKFAERKRKEIEAEKARRVAEGE